MNRALQLNDLHRINEEMIRLAGPRYSPGLNPTAPNIEISELLEAFSALAMAPQFRERLKGIVKGYDSAAHSGRYTFGRVFNRAKSTTTVTSVSLHRLLTLTDINDVRDALGESRRLLRAQERILSHALIKAYESLSGLTRDDSHQSERRRIEGHLQDIRELSFAVEMARSYLDGAPGRLLADTPFMVLLGKWGTGKTHFLCDVATKSVSTGTPVLLALASSLAPGVNPLDALALRTKLAANGNQLLERLDDLGRRTQQRAVIVVDAINEGDREVWRDSLDQLGRLVAAHAHLAIVLSCRRPFDETIFNLGRNRNRFVSVECVGFVEREFDAQLEFFSYYDITAPHAPLLTPEYSNPLFLKLLCESLKDLTPTGKHRQLHDIASGQKGMNYVLENFVRNVGEPIERDFGLPGKRCWLLLKGHGGNLGIAGSMASLGREYLTRSEALQCILDLGISVTDGAHFLSRMTADGLLAEDLKYHLGFWVEAIVFPYQRFGDNLIARHLLGTHLSPTTATEQSIRRLFYKGTALGRAFELDSWSGRFREPGLAAALMLEFPERMKKSHLPKELLHYLPRSRQYVTPMKEPLLEGLYWRSATSFTPDTDRIVNFMLCLDDESIRDKTFEVLMTLATRSQHPYNAARLTSYLSAMTMSERDGKWTEFIRRAGEHSIVYRALEWVERAGGNRRTVSEAKNEIQLLSLMLTSTVRELRDRATRAIVEIGQAHPSVLFQECVASLEFNDPYVSERMMAAAYGITMRLWSASDGGALRSAIVPFARELVRAMFLPNAKHATSHELTRDYALGVISLARRIHKHAIATQYVRYLSAQSRAVGMQFPEVSSIPTSVEDAVGSALHMDFENYTIGSLVLDRGNYQMNHPEYASIRKQILWRIGNLGYTKAQFGAIDDRISRYSWNLQDGSSADRYGKKYSWIAYFEMYGHRADEGLLEARRLIERSSDADLDPSFPVSAPTWNPPIRDTLAGSLPSGVRWLRSPVIPDYGLLFRVEVIDGIAGPWVLLDGFLLERADEREVFVFLRGLFIRDRDLEQCRNYVDSSKYLGNSRIPEGGRDYYTYAGEIPWSSRFGVVAEDNSGRKSNGIDYIGRRCHDVRVEVPVWTWTWEGHHSPINQVGTAIVPSPAICDRLSLHGQHASFDLRDVSDQPASLYREWSNGEDGHSRSHAMYLREDLVKQYLGKSGQKLVWIPWGERNFYRARGDVDRSPAIVTAMQEDAHTFCELIEWDGNP